MAVEQRPALDELVRDAKRRRFDVLVCWRLDRLGRSLKHLITLLDDLQALGVAFVSLTEGIDATTPAGKLQMHILGAISEFERARIAERVRAGLARVRREGRRLGRPPARIPQDAVESVRGLSVREAARRLGVSLPVDGASRPGPEPRVAGGVPETLIWGNRLSPRIAEVFGLRISRFGWSKKEGFSTTPVAPTPPSSAASPVPVAGGGDSLRVEWLDLREHRLMALTAGTRLGHYELPALLGEEARP